MIFKKYEPHIDGLRTVAVMLVILFHWKIKYFLGGYIGVDIFFVISGYLIGKNIIREYDTQNKFSFIEFYLRRFRRLFPALVTTLFLCILASIIFLDPTEFVRFGKSLVASTLSLSNVQFWIESGYFDASQLTKPLLHTWSLGVEEQFYLIWPALLVFSLNSRLLRPPVTIALIGIFSFFLNWLIVNNGEPGFKDTIFFLTPFRIFEFCIGTLGVYLTNRFDKTNLRLPFTCLGWIFILYSLFKLDSTSLFPYYNALGVCIGTLLLILTGAQKNPFNFIINNKVAVFLGLLSYPLYLVHWPIYIFANHYYDGQISNYTAASLIILSIVLAWFIFAFVETRSKAIKADLDNLKECIIFFITPLAVVFLIGFSIAISDGWLWRYKIFNGNFKPLSDSAVQEGRARRHSSLAATCSIENLDDSSHCLLDRATQILTIGNSTEVDGYNIIREIYKENKNVNIISFGSTNGCQAKLENGQYISLVHTDNCNFRFSKLYSKDFLPRIKVVVLNAQALYKPWNIWMLDMVKTLTDINSDIKVIVIGSYLSLKTDCPSIYNKKKAFEFCKDPEFVDMDYFEPNEKSTSHDDNLKLNYIYISKIELLCKNNKLQNCEVYGGGEPWTWDSTHLSFGFAKYLAHKIVKNKSNDLISAGLPQP